MIIHFANQSQTCQLSKILKNIFFQTFHEKKLWKAINPRLNWYNQERHIYILSSWLNNLSQVCKSEFTRWAIIEELSIRRRLCTFLISWGQKTHMKHCNVDLSSWYELWFAICINMDVILDLSTAIQQFKRRFRLLVSTWRTFFTEIQWHEIILAPLCLC